MAVTYSGEHLGIVVPEGFAKDTTESFPITGTPVLHKLAHYDDGTGTRGTRAVLVYGVAAKEVAAADAIHWASLSAMTYHAQFDLSALRTSNVVIGGIPGLQSVLTGEGSRYWIGTYLRGAVRFTVVLWTYGKATLSPSIIRPNGC